MPLPSLNERERRVLEAVIQAYVETAQPAGSRSLAHRFGLGIPPVAICAVSLRRSIAAGALIGISEST